MAYEQFPDFVTTRGTKLPILNLKGKPYLQVAHRIAWFREDHPTNKIIASAQTSNNDYVLFKAEIFRKDDTLWVTAHKREDQKHFADFIEKAETGSIGRALALIGYGTQFTASEFDEGERLADAPVGQVKNINRDRLLADVYAYVKKMTEATSAETTKTFMLSHGFPSWDDVIKAPTEKIQALSAKLREELRDG